MSETKRLLLIGIIMSCAVFAAAQDDTCMWSVSSPNNAVTICIRQDTSWKLSGAPNGLYIAVTHGGDTVMHWSPVGIQFSEYPYSNLPFYEQRVSEIHERDAHVSGKRAIPLNHCRELKLFFGDSAEQQVAWAFRAYDKGAAYQYRVFGTGSAAVHKEHCGFAFPQGSKLWLQQVTKNYEAPFDTFTVGDSADYSIYGNFPVLCRTSTNRWVLLTEAAVLGNYAAAHFVPSNTLDLLSLALPQNVIVDTLPWTMPWRVLIIGDDLADIVSSDLVVNLNPGPQITNTNWIKPGRVAWSWWSDSDSPKSLETQKEFVDFAHQMGWEYVLIDDGWDEAWIQDIVAYATPKNVGIHVWYRWTDMDAAGERQQLMSQLNTWGVKGIKVDFIDNDTQDRMKFYDDVLKDAGIYELLVNFHGAMLPRGIRKHHPHLLAQEGVYGAEHYKWSDALFGPPTPYQNCILPFTRNVVGPMDYTPVTFSASRRTTSDAHELALSVVFECGLQHFADSPESYSASGAMPFLKKVPVAWDDIRFVDGSPGQFVAVARRSNDEWYFAGINAGPAQSVTIPLKTIIKSGTYACTLYADSANGKLMSVDTSFASENDLTIDMIENGGFCFWVGNAHDSTLDSFEMATQPPAAHDPAPMLAIQKAFSVVTIITHSHATIELFDAKGRAVYRARALPGIAAKVLRSALPPGIVIARITTGSSRYHTTFFNR